MPAIILPDTFAVLLTAFQPCFHAPSYRNFQLLVAGWIHCLGRRTVTSVVLAAGAVGQRHLSVFHRCFARARWSLDAVGRVVFTLALAWLPADAPRYLLVDATLARKHGKCIGLASMHHDPLRSTGRKPFTNFGHVWVTLALWVPLPIGPQRGFALPLLFHTSPHDAARCACSDSIRGPFTIRKNRTLSIRRRWTGVSAWGLDPGGSLSEKTE